MNPLSYYKKLLTSQYQGKAKLQAWLSVLLQPFVDIGNCADNMYLAFDVDLAVGVQLDTIGLIVGTSRILPYQPANGSAVLNDDDFRILVKAKIIQNRWDGKIVSIQQLWKTLFVNSSINIIDNQDMSFNVTMQGNFSDIVKEMISKGLIIPKPQGVKLNVSIGVPFFGFDEDNADVSGFDVGYWGG